jgi:hypothetical protein
LTIRLSDLMRERRTLTVTMGDETCDVVYNPGSLTPELAARVADEKEAPIAALLSQVLIEWDLYDDSERDNAGNPVQVGTDFETLTGLPSKFLLEVQRAIMADVLDQKNSEKPSGAGSLPGGKWEKRRTSTR